MRLAFILFFCCLISTAYSQVVIESGAYNLAEEFYEEAVKSYEAGKYSVSIIKFGRAIRLNPNNSDYFFGRATAYYELAGYDSAKADIDRAIEMEAGQPDYLYRAGNICFHAKQYQEAFSYYTQALDASKTTTDVAINLKNCRYNRGVCALYLERYEEAVLDFGQIFQEDPTFYEALHNRGVAYKNLKNYDAACEDFTLCVNLGLERSKQYIEKYCTGKYR